MTQNSPLYRSVEVDIVTAMAAAVTLFLIPKDTSLHLLLLLSSLSKDSSTSQAKRGIDPEDSLEEPISEHHASKHVHFDEDSFQKSANSGSDDTSVTMTMDDDSFSLGSVPSLIDMEEELDCPSPSSYRQRSPPTRRTSIEEKRQRKRELEAKLEDLLHQHDYNIHHDQQPQQPVQKSKPFVRPNLIPAPLSHQSLILAPAPLSPRLNTAKSVCPSSCHSSKVWITPSHCSISAKSA